MLGFEGYGKPYRAGVRGLARVALRWVRVDRRVRAALSWGLSMRGESPFFQKQDVSISLRRGTYWAASGAHAGEGVDAGCMCGGGKLPGSCISKKRAAIGRTIKQVLAARRSGSARAALHGRAFGRTPGRRRAAVSC